MQKDITMFIEDKVLLRINLQGGSLIREEEVTKIEWALTLGDVKDNADKIPAEIASTVVRRGRTKHYNLVDKPAIMTVTLSQLFYNYATSSESYEPWMRKLGVEKGKYMKSLTIEERLKLHLTRLTEHHRGTSFTYQILS